MNAPLIPDYLIQSLYLTLIHSLWQGLLLAGITALIMISTRKASSLQRYNLLIASLVLFAAGGIFTFVITWNQMHVQTVTTVTGYNMAAFGGAARSGTAAGPHSFIEGLKAFLNTNATNIVLLWFLVICIRSLQLVMGLQGLRCLRRTAIIKADSHVRHYVNDLATKIGIHQIVDLAESGIAKVPMVIGHLKPLILIPAGLITALPAAELEAILIHELAHIRRRDYLVNLLQSLMEIVFFFNPAIWWLSSLIRAERENCCDDIVVRQTSSKKDYISALVSCEEYHLPSQAYAMALKGGKRHLSRRVKRIISNSNASLNRIEKSMLAVCLVAAGFFMVAFANKTNRPVPATDRTISAAVEQEKAVRKEQVEPLINQQVTVASPQSKKQVIIQPVPAIQVANILPRNKECLVANEAIIIAPPRLAQKGTVIILNAAGLTRPQQPDVAAEQETIQQQEEAQRVQEEAIRRREEELRQREEERRQQRDIARIQRDEERRQQRDIVRIQRDEARRQQEEVRRRQQDAARLQQDEARRKQDEVRLQQDEARRKQDEALRRQEEITRRKQGSSSDQVVAGLVKDGIISKRDKSVSFTLNNEAFIVNKVKQPQQVFLKYRDNYTRANSKKGNNWSVSYERSVAP